MLANVPVTRPAYRAAPWWVLLVVELLALPQPAHAQCTLAAPCVNAPIGLGTLSGANSFLGSSSATGGSVSSDGSVVVGFSSTNGTYHAFRWTSAGMADLGTLGGNSDSYAYGVSGNGSVVVGYSLASNGYFHAFRWTSAGMVDIGTLNGAIGNSLATGVNNDGSVVVGRSDVSNGYYHAFRWTSAGMVDIGTLNGNSAYSWAYGINGDGSVVVGRSDVSNGYSHAFRWTSSGMVDLGTLNGNSANSLALHVSGDGSVVVGRSDVSNGYYHAFRWTSAGMVDLGTLNGNTANSIAFGTNRDGSVVVGISDSPGPGNAFRWTAATGMQNLTTLLTNAGVNMSGITLSSALGVSANGQFITGNGSLGGINQAYLVRYYDGTPAPIGGMTTVASVQQSMNSLADSRNGLGAQQHGLVAPLLGGDQPISNSNQAGTFTSFGSFTAGGTIRYSFGSGLSVLGGIAYAKETYPDADLTRSATFAGAVRYVMGRGWLTPYVEGGGWYAPNTGLTFSRTYDNGAGTATGSGSTSGSLGYAFAKAGVLFNQGRNDQLGLAAEYGHQWLTTNGYLETLTQQNPFNALVSAGTDTTNLVKLKAQWTHRFDSRFDTTLWAAAVHGFNRTTDVQATVAGVGTLAPTALPALTWAEFGARIGYKWSDRMTVDVFANGVAGPQGISNQTHAGIALRYAY